jgi:hypothetical protein
MQTQFSSADSVVDALRAVRAHKQPRATLCMHQDAKRVLALTATLQVQMQMQQLQHQPWIRAGKTATLPTTSAANNCMC